MDRLEVEQLFHHERWAEFVRAARKAMVPGWKEPVHWWTMLARAYRKLGKRPEAKRALETGVERYPRHALCHAFLGTWLARESAGKPEVRKQALRHWRRAVKFDGDTFAHLGEEAAVLEALPPNAPYPPVKERVLRYVSALKASGLFEDLSVDQVVRQAIDDLGTDVVYEARSDLESFLSLERHRYLESDWRYSARDVLADASKLLEPHEVVLRFEREGVPGRAGNRTVEFTVDGKSHKCKVKGVDDLARALNRRLKASKSRHRLYQMTRSKMDDQYEFLLLRPAEAAALRKRKLIAIELP